MINYYKKAGEKRKKTFNPGSSVFLLDGYKFHIKQGNGYDTAKHTPLCVLA